jgi:hypothetical protein
MKKNTGYSSAILQLSRYVKQQTLDLKKEGMIKLVPVPYLKEKFENLVYKEGSFTYSSKFENITIEELDWRDLIDKEKFFYESEPYKKTLDKLSESFNNVTRDQLNYYLSRLINRLIFEIVNGSTDERIEEIAISFTRDLEGTPNYWNPLVWLTGIWMQDEEIEINKNLIFRIPKEEDIAKKYDLSIFPPITYYFGRLQHMNPMSIMELSIKGKGQPEIHFELQKLMVLLRLYKIGSVQILKTEWKTDSIINFGGTTTSGIDYFSPYKYPLSKEDSARLKKFLDIIGPLIPKESYESRSSTENTDFSVIAIQRYMDAILKSEINESRLTFAIMSLESIYLKEMERDELEHRLSQRLAKLLGFCNFNKLEVYNTLMRSYGIRSSFVHGSPISQDRINEARKLLEKVLEYDRLSILIFLQLKNEKKKDALLSLIDNSLLEEKSNSKLENLIINK